MYTHLLGIDYGASKIGLALSEHGEFAQAYATIHQKGKKALLQELTRICQQEAVQHIVFGLPFSLQGHEKENDRTAHIRQFALFLQEHLRAHGLQPTIHFQNEQLTTRMAGHFLSPSSPDDEKSAELLLQQFIDMNKNHGN